jgi:hypothetical protein
MSLDPSGKGRQWWSNRWKGALNAFDITFDGRLSAGRKYHKSSLRMWRWFRIGVKPRFAVLRPLRQGLSM